MFMKRKSNNIKKPKQKQCFMYYVTFEDGSEYFVPSYDEVTLKQRICLYFPSYYTSIELKYRMW